MITEQSYNPATDTVSREQLLAMLPELRKRDEGGVRVKIDNHTWIIKRPTKAKQNGRK